MREAGADAWPVAGREGFRGMVGRDAVEGALASGEGGPTIAGLVREAADPGEPESGAHVHPEPAIGVALARMGAAGLAALPVVSRRNARELLGIVTLQDLLAEFGLGAPRDARSGDV
jgi:CBS domain-containing protein